MFEIRNNIIFLRDVHHLVDLEIGLNYVLRCDFDKLVIKIDHGYYLYGQKSKLDDVLMNFIKINKKIKYLSIEAETFMRNEYLPIEYEYFPKILSALDNNRVIKKVCFSIQAIYSLYFNKYIENVCVQKKYRCSNDMIIRKWFYQVCDKKLLHYLILFLKN